MVRVYQSRLLTKRGRYGASKTKTFIVLGKGIWSARQLCVLTGIGYHSLGRTLCRWVSFGYLTRAPIEYGGDFVYRLEPKGKAWLRLASRYLPNYQLFMDELDKWQRNLTDEALDELLSIPFKEFICNLDDMITEFKKNNGENA